jgi:hypothetical protein
VIAASFLFAQSTSGTPGQVVYELSRLRDFDDLRLPVALGVVLVTLLASLVWWLYRRDTVELPRRTGFILAILRLIAFAGLVVYFLGIERRSTRDVVNNSQVAVLIDVSQSMGLPASDDSTAGGETSRLDEIVAVLEQSPLIASLRRSHDVNLLRFDRETEPVAAFGQISTLSDADNPSPDTSTISTGGASSDPPSTAGASLASQLQPRGTETRLGQALDYVLRLYRDKPLAGVVVVTDGAQNAGVEPTAAMHLAGERKIPFYTIGVGSKEPQRNVAIRDLIVPARAFPGDTVDVAGFLQATGFANRELTVELLRRRSEEPEGGTAIATERVTLRKDGEVASVNFRVEPDQTGTFVYGLRLLAPDGDANARDNAREAEVEVIDRKTKVLLFASGPMRDYQYLRNQLFRDKSMTVDIFLQSAQPGISQDANKILDHFPSTREELFAYDGIVAFDPKWTALDAEQCALLESWVAEEAGGLIVVAGPIHTAELARSAEHGKIRDLYPVTFQQRFTLMSDGQYGGQTAWPLEFESAGREAKFLWLGQTAAASAAAWDDFAGVYGYFDVKGPKPGATVYSRFSDPQTAGLTGDRPVYLAGQFFGAGQVFYIGSGELWRLRSLNPAHFEVLYTKLIRHVSQGRILRGSSRGALMVERDRYELGESVVVRARLSDAQHNPLSVDSVGAQVLVPDGDASPIRLKADVDRPGMYLGQFKVLQEGTYRIALSPPGGEEQPLTRFIQARVPDLERRQAERNEPLLVSLAHETGGIYYSRLNAAVQGEEKLPPLAEAIPNRAEVTTIKGAPDKVFAERQMHWLLVVVAGALFVEWIVRRLHRLA